MKRFLKPWIIAVAVVILAGGGFLIYRAVHNKSAVTYKTAQVTKGTLTVSVTGTGNVAVTNSAVINPGISGTVTDLAVSVGDQVKKGQTLFKISNDDLDISVEKAYATYLQAKQSVENAKSQLLDARNNQTTIDNDSKSTDDIKNAAAQKVTAAQSSVDVAGVNVDSANSQYQQAKTTAAKRTVKATIDGTITTINIRNGDQLGSSSSSGSSSSGQTSSGSSNSSSSSGSSSSSSSSSSSAPIVIDDLSNLKASVSINEVDATSVQSGQKASMTFDAIDGLTLTGKVEQISTVGTNSSGVVTYPATISFDSLDGKVKPGMSLTATVTTDVKQDVLMVANSAVKTQTDGTKYVQIMQNGKPVSQTVEVGKSNDTETEITSGLKEGDTVVTQTVTSSTSSSSASGPSSSSSNRAGSGGIGGFGGFGG
ncbi:MAG: efflux RND transporter periplasmic adaptor subunit [Candidatus Berkelbacteria bacterium]|nr:efflux RND transporter periplasmic adaptor subunit [Candidatus Berkelbacteria bacterium]